jgi:hypothetical protein
VDVKDAVDRARAYPAACDQYRYTRLSTTIGIAAPAVVVIVVAYRTASAGSKSN